MKTKETSEPKRALAARAFTAVEDVVYLGLGVLLSGSAIALLVSSAISFVQSLLARSLSMNIVPLLDRLLLSRRTTIDGALLLYVCNDLGVLGVLAVNPG